MIGMAPLIIIAVIVVFTSIKILNEYERGVILTFGRFTGVKGPGLIFLVPGIQQMFRMSTRVVVLDVPPQDVITRDNISVKVNAVIYFRVVNPQTAVLNVENYMYATSQLAQTTLRSVLGQQELDDLLANRDKINKNLQEILDLHTEPWGIKISSVEVKNVDLRQEMQRAIAKQAEAERERRAIIINSQGAATAVGTATAYTNMATTRLDFTYTAPLPPPPSQSPPPPPLYPIALPTRLCVPLAPAIARAPGTEPNPERPGRVSSGSLES